MHTENEQFEQKLREFLGAANGSRYDASVIIYDLLLESDNPKMAFMYFLENANYIDSSNEKEVDAYFTAQQLKKYEKEYSEFVDALLNKLVSRHYEKEKFYDELWESVIESDLLFDDKDAKIYAIGRIWSDARVPYFCLKDGIKMSNEEFAGIIDDNKKLLQEVTFILGCKYEQKTETSSMLIDVLERCQNEKEKAVVMGKILDLVEKRVVIDIINNTKKI